MEREQTPPDAGALPEQGSPILSIWEALPLGEDSRRGILRLHPEALFGENTAVGVPALVIKGHG